MFVWTLLVCPISFVWNIHLVACLKSHFKDHLLVYLDDIWCLDLDNNNAVALFTYTYKTALNYHRSLVYRSHYCLLKLAVALQDLRQILSWHLLWDPLIGDAKVWIWDHLYPKLMVCYWAMAPPFLLLQMLEDTPVSASCFLHWRPRGGRLDGRDSSVSDTQFT